MLNPTLLCFILTTTVILIHPSSSTAPTTAATDTYIYAYCSQPKFSPGSTYETNLNSLLSSLVNSTTFNRYSNLTVPSYNVKPDSGVTLYGLFQCRGDLDQTSCSSCVSRAVSLIGPTCTNAYSGSLQMENCYVRYDNTSFFGVLDKKLFLNKCGQPMGFNDQDALTRAGDVMSTLGSGSGSFRTGGNGDVQGVAQCTEDLSLGECQDCLSDAIGRLRSDCGMSQGGYVYLSKCYARFSYGGSHAGQNPSPNFGGTNNNNNKNNDGLGKTLAIIIGIITLVILLVVFLAFLGKQCRKLQENKCYI